MPKIVIKQSIPCPGNPAHPDLYINKTVEIDENNPQEGTIQVYCDFCRVYYSVTLPGKPVKKNFITRLLNTEHKDDDDT